MSPTTRTPALPPDTAPSRDAGRPFGPSPVPAVVSAGLRAPVLGGGSVEYANLDHAASAPALACVQRAVETATRSYASVHRGTGHASRVTTAYHEAAREEVAAFVGARPGDEVVFTRNTTDSFNLLARCLPEDTTVVVFGTEHHAALLPWDRGRTVRLAVPTGAADAAASLAGALAGTTPGRTLVVLAGASNVTGELWPVRRLAALARAHGARVALDAAQLAPHRPVDLTALGVDYVAFSGHKLYAPYGAGALVGPRDWLDAAPPYLAGGGATASVTAETTSWQRGPARHEAGSPNVLGTVALAAACAALRESRRAVEAHELRVGRRVLAGLRAIPGVRTYAIFGEEGDRLPVACFTVAGVEPDLVSAALSAEHGIGVRDGRFCAHPLLDTLLAGAAGSSSGGVATAVRVSAGLATRDEHVERLLGAVDALARGGPAHAYVRDASGRWQPEQETRELEVPLPW